MSFIRFSSDRHWFAGEPLYVYQTSDAHLEDYGALTEPTAFAEVALRMLAQSGELSDDELRRCQRGFAARLSIEDAMLEHERQMAQDERDFDKLTDLLVDEDE